MTPVFVARVLSMDPDGENAVVLQEITGRQRIKIRTSATEMFALRAQMDPSFRGEISVHDVVGRLLKWHDAKLVKICIFQHPTGLFHSLLTVKSHDRRWNLSAAPVDAILLALKNHVSLWVREMEPLGAEGSLQDRILFLKAALEKAITFEAYEDAAKLRDQIRDLERGSV